MHVLSRLADRLDRLDQGFRWARLDRLSAQRSAQRLDGGPVGLASHPLPDLDLAAQDALELSHDPAKGGKVDNKSLQEGAVAVLAQHLEVLPELRRETTGHSEFCDRQGQNWDVKSPVSPDRQGWIFDPHHHLEVLRDDLNRGEGILLDLSALRTDDSRSLLQCLEDGLSLDQRGRVLVFLDESLV